MKKTVIIIPLIITCVYACTKEPYPSFGLPISPTSYVQSQESKEKTFSRLAELIKFLSQGI